MKTTQPIQTRKTSEKLLHVSRKFSKSFPAPVPADVPLSLNLVAKDLVRSLVSGEKADKSLDGKYVDILGEDGERIKVVGRIPSPDATGGYFVNFVSESATLGFSKPQDRPDSVYVVFYNRFLNSVDIFSVPVDPASNKALPTSCIRFSTVKQSYLSFEKYLVSSTLVS